MRIGVLGGGQLALMLASAIQKLGLNPLCLGPSDCPASHTSETTEDLQTLIAQCQHIVIENEFLDASMEKSLQAAPLTPTWDVIQLFSNKLEQKKQLIRLQLPTTPYTEKHPNMTPEDWVLYVQSQFPQGAVIKWSRMGYDGIGTHFLKDPISAVEFIKKAKNIPVYAEEKIAFDKELAQVTAFSTFNKDFFHFPLVETKQVGGICKSVYCYEDTDLSQKTSSYAEKLASSSHLFGVFAIEFFLKGKQLWINEIAPRVHNSGHWSQNTNLSQFEAHIMAALGWPFPKIAYPKYFGMHNILGQKTRWVSTLKKNIDMIGHPSVYWYGKKQLRHGRKLGHVNFMTNNLEEVEHLDRLSQQISRQLAY